jgi:hypothetical protein
MAVPNLASRPLDILRSRLHAVATHLELVDAALEAVDHLAATADDPGAKLASVLRLTPHRSRRLNQKARSHRTVTNHARSRNAEHTIQLAYTHLTTYLRKILREMFRTKPLQIVDKAQGHLRYFEIVQLGSYETICDAMVDQVFRTIESQKSTPGLIEKLLDRTGVTIADNVLADALMYVEMRHLIVHNGGIVDDKFFNVYGSRASDAHVGRRLSSSIGIARRALRAIEQLCVDIDAGLYRAGYLTPVASSDNGANPETPTD